MDHTGKNNSCFLVDSSAFCVDPQDINFHIPVISIILVTERKSSCGKVLFSQASVILSTGGSHDTPHRRILRDTVNKRAVRILLECIPVFKMFSCLN